MTNTKIRLETRSFQIEEHHEPEPAQRRMGVALEGTVVEIRKRGGYPHTGRRYLAKFFDKGDRLRVVLIPTEGRGKSLAGDIPKPEA